MWWNKNNKYGHPFQLEDSAISATPVAGRCIKSSTHSCNIHRQTLAVEWSYWELRDFQCGTVMGCHLSTCVKFASFPTNLSNSCPARAAPVNCKCCYCEGETARSKKLIERDRWVLKSVARKNSLLSVATLTTEFQTAYELPYQHKNGLPGASWNAFPWPSLLTQA